MKRPLDWGDMPPMTPTRWGRMICRLRRHHQIKHTTARYDLCITCGSRWLTK